MISYGGDKYDPAQGDNKFSFDVLKKSVDELIYVYEPGKEDSNIVKVLIKE